MYLLEVSENVERHHLDQKHL